MKGKAYRKGKTRANVSFGKVRFNCVACKAAFAFNEF